MRNLLLIGIEKMLDLLPEEIVVVITLSLNGPSVLSLLEITCKKWKRMIEERRCWYLLFKKEMFDDKWSEDVNWKDRYRELYFSLPTLSSPHWTLKNTTNGDEARYFINHRRVNIDDIRNALNYPYGTRSANSGIARGSQPLGSLDCSVMSKVDALLDFIGDEKFHAKELLVTIIRFVDKMSSIDANLPDIISVVTKLCKKITFHSNEEEYNNNTDDEEEYNNNTDDEEEYNNNTDDEEEYNNNIDDDDILDIFLAFKTLMRMSNGEHIIAPLLPLIGERLLDEIDNDDDDLSHNEIDRLRVTIVHHLRKDQLRNWIGTWSNYPIRSNSIREAIKICCTDNSLIDPCLANPSRIVEFTEKGMNINHIDEKGHSFFYRYLEAAGHLNNEQIANHSEVNRLSLMISVITPLDVIMMDYIPDEVSIDIGSYRDPNGHHLLQILIINGKNKKLSKVLNGELIKKTIDISGDDTFHLSLEHNSSLATTGKLIALGARIDKMVIRKLEEIMKGLQRKYLDSDNNEERMKIEELIHLNAMKLKMVQSSKQ